MIRRYAWALALFLAVGASARASIIWGYAPSLPSPNNPGGPAVYDPRFDRFSTNFPTEGPIAAPAGNLLFGQGSGVNIDLSGVGWVTNDQVRGLTMVSPNNFIAAAHSGLITGAFAPGNQVSFLTTGGTIFTTTIAANMRVPSVVGASNPVTDILFGTLTNPVPAGVRIYSIASGPINPTTEIGMYTMEQRVGLNRPSGLFGDVTLGEGDSTNVFISDFQPNTPGIGYNPGETLYTVGDSGAPSFIIEGGDIRLLGHHMAVTNISGIDYTVDSYLPDYKMTIENLIAVPEPTSFVLAGIAASGWYIRRRRQTA
ncbi:MAG: PEP-CTERM sorting domain-containing protein [Gemmataceae bacterium]|nr:PEP-CTERM sorting domain-containing protein [Gemmataceae bacterium]